MTIKFGAVAGGKYRSFVNRVDVAQGFQRRFQYFRREGQTFAYSDGRGVVINPYGKKSHFSVESTYENYCILRNARFLSKLNHARALN
jgi:hypothetical protein